MIFAALLLAPVFLAAVFQGVAGLAAGWKGASWAALIVAIILAVLLFNHHAIPMDQRNDRTGLGEILAYGSWLAFAESLVVFLTGRLKASAQQKEEFE